MTGFRPELTSQTALKADAVAFLAKPFMLLELLDVIYYRWDLVRLDKMGKGQRQIADPD
jgi:hypothetical protein